MRQKLHYNLLGNPGKYGKNTTCNTYNIMDIISNIMNIMKRPQDNDYRGQS